MDARLRCPYRALVLGALMMGLGMLVGGPPASADLVDGVPVPTVPAVTTPTTVALDGSTPTTVATSTDGASADQLTSTVTAPPSAGDTVTGAVNGATESLTATMDPALATIVGSVQGILALINGTVESALPADDDGDGGSGAASDATGGAGESSRIGSADVGGPAGESTAGAAGARSATGGRVAPAATIPSAHDLASLRKAALQAAQDFALPFMLGVLALGYLVFQSRTERHEPRLASDPGEELLRFR